MRHHRRKGARGFKLAFDHPSRPTDISISAGIPQPASIGRLHPVRPSVMWGRRTIKSVTLAPKGASQYDAIGVVRSRMKKRLAIRLLALVLLVSVAGFATHAISHGHSSAADDLHCQFCHIGHVAIPQPAPHVVMQAPVTVARFTPPEPRKSSLEPVRTQRSPRAPPTDSLA